jgi:GntR family histidine utilization transcriptional repressor
LTLTEPNSWRLIRDEVVRRINERVWRPGDLIPNEAELAGQFGCARSTVNRALRELAEAGLVIRRRKAGTRVSLNPVHKATFSIPIIRLDIERRGSLYRHVLLELKPRKVPPLIRGALDLPEGFGLIYMRVMHLADNRPFIYEERWINPEAVPGIDAVDFNAVSANEWLVQHTPFTHGDLVFLAQNATKTEADLLDTKEGVAIFVMERTTWNGQQPITSVRLAHAPGYRMLTTL